MASTLSTPWGRWAGIVVTMLVGAFAQTMMKLGTQRVGEFGDTPVVPYVIKLLTNPFVILAICAYGAGVILYMFILSLVDLSYIYPVMTALGMVLTAIVARLVFGESISVQRLGGIAVIILGVFITGRS
jgi:multidrug transporter EmrE-like cation transporter